MTNEQAIRRLEDLQRLYLGNEKFTADIEAIGIAIEALEQTRWIPVGERLPKEKGNYLVCYNDGYISVSEWHPNPYEKVCFDLFPSLIVAWMPIMPYKAESEEEIWKRLK